MAKSELKKIAVLTSGGDAPGMNAAIRAVVRTATGDGLEVVGVKGGYVGLVEDQMTPLAPSSVANIIQRGGTILKTGRALEFHQAPVRAKAAQNLKARGIQALVTIGGDGTFQGANLLSQEHQLAVVGVPGTIDNDIFGTEETIGFDTAVNTALEAIDRVRDTAASHDRLFIVEVMGRASGFIAIDVGLAGGAEEVFIPEFPIDLDQVIQSIRRGQARGKTSSILVTAEGASHGSAYNLAKELKDRAGLDAKVCVLGHIQRGGAPTSRDRILAGRLGHAAVRALQSGQSNVMVGVQAGQVVTISLRESIGKQRRVPSELMQLAQLLAQ